VIPAGVDTDLFAPEGDRAPRHTRYRLVAAAPAGQPHGLPSVVRALAQLAHTDLVVVGGPDGRHLPRTGPWRELCQLATRLGVRSRITFAGDVPEAELPALLRSADLMVSAHGYEPTGIAAIRAMACGVPVVAAGAGAHKDAIIDGVSGLLITPESPGMLAHRVRTLLARPVQLQALGYAAADRAQSRYALDRIGRETAAAYECCVRGQAAAPAASVPMEDAEEAGVRELVALG
jgi:glycosyltransferase involved in cell wall biosynthesis